MKALLIADDAGRGHQVRCEALAAELERRAWQAQIIGPNDEARMADYSVVISDMRDNVFPIPEAQRLVRIVDAPGTVGVCNLLVCGSAGADPDQFKGIAARVLAGPLFSLLRRDFMDERAAWFAQSETEREAVAVPDGSGAICDLREIEGWDGPYLAAELSRANVAITYAGMRAMEAACMGCALVLIPRNAGERLNAAGLMEAGAAIVVEDEAELAVMAQEMLGLPSLVLKMGMNARNFVDGKGCARVAQAIGEMMK